MFRLISPLCLSISPLGMTIYGWAMSCGEDEMSRARGVDGVGEWRQLDAGISPPHAGPLPSRGEGIRMARGRGKLGGRRWRGGGRRRWGRCIGRGG